MPELRSEALQQEVNMAERLETRAPQAEVLLGERLIAGTSVVVNYEKGTLEVRFPDCGSIAR